MGGAGSVHLAELNALPAIRDKTRLAVVDALFGTYESGLYGRPDFSPMTLIVASVPVIVVLCLLYLRQRRLLPIRAIRRGDVIVFKQPDHPEDDYIKQEKYVFGAQSHRIRKLADPVPIQGRFGYAAVRAVRQTGEIVGQGHAGQLVPGQVQSL